MSYMIDTDNDFNENDDTLSLKDLEMYDQTATSSTRSSPRYSSASHELFEFFPNVPAYDLCDERSTPIDHAVRSISNRDMDSPRHFVKFSTSLKKVNVTTLTSMPRSKSKRMMMFMFGPVKFMPEMEMSEIRERQARRPPSSRMFPVADSDGDTTNLVTRKDQPVTSCRARLNSVFERSLACIRPSMEV